MSIPTDEQLVEAVERILQPYVEADKLAELTNKIVRKKLEEEFKCDLAEKKSVVNEAIKTAIANAQSEVEEEEEEVDAKPKHILNKPLRLSNPLAKLLGVEESTRPGVVKKMWEYIRKHNLQNPANKQQIVLDDPMQAVFQRTVFTIFSMNKYLSRHLKKAGDDSEFDLDGCGESTDEETRAANQKKKLATKKSRKGVKRVRKESDEPKAKSTGGLNQPVKLSSELAAFVGKPEESRPQVVKALWKYIKENDLQLPDDKRQIRCDATLKKLMGVDQVSMMTMNKLISPHFGKTEKQKAAAKENGTKKAKKEVKKEVKEEKVKEEEEDGDEGAGSEDAGDEEDE